MSSFFALRTVARYESKLLFRSWFFRIFCVLTLLILGLVNYLYLFDEETVRFPSIFRNVPANIPYLNLLVLNVAQAVVAVFLATDFFKRDKKFDTSEVFYVRPISNSAYLLGKMWGNLRVFFLLDLAILALVGLLNAIATDCSVDYVAYPLYFLLICLPTLVYVIGLSFFVVQLLRNQALTFTLLVGYIAAILFYGGDTCYHLLDFLALNVPLFKSAIVGFTNLPQMLLHRFFYLFLGAMLLVGAILRFTRLPNQVAAKKRESGVLFVTMLCAATIGYCYIRSFTHEQEQRACYIAVNNQYAGSPTFQVFHYDLNLTQQEKIIQADATLHGMPTATDSLFVLCLNPGFVVDSVLFQGNPLAYTRQEQLLLLHFQQRYAPTDTLTFSVYYQGRAEECFSFLDIDSTKYHKAKEMLLLKVDQKSLFQTPDYLLFTPESYWYPRSGTAYSNTSSAWLQNYFSSFKTRIKPLPGMVPFSQGARSLEPDSLTYLFETDKPCLAASLAIGRYRKHVIEVEGCSYELAFIEGHDYFSAVADTVADTIPSIIKDIRGRFLYDYKLGYPYNRFSAVEVPLSFGYYPRQFTKAQEVMQAETVFYPEFGGDFYFLDLASNVKNYMMWNRYEANSITLEQATFQAINTAVAELNSPSSVNGASGGRGTFNVEKKANPYFIFPLLFNYCFNISSPKLPVGTRLIELYLERKQSENDDWEREYNGISDDEKANILLGERSLNDLLSDPKVGSLLNNILYLKATDIFADAEIKAGLYPLRSKLYDLLYENYFRNIPFETLIDTLGAFTQTDLRGKLDGWDKPLTLPRYTVGESEVLYYNHRGEDLYVVRTLISNDSPVEGVVLYNTQVGDWDDQYNNPKTNRRIALAPHTTYEIITCWPAQPSKVGVNTLLSSNIPSYCQQKITGVKSQRKPFAGTEGIFVVPKERLHNPKEIIVDNEDPALFSLVHSQEVGLLPGWLDRLDNSEYKYSGVPWWRTPLQWTATTNTAYYGQYVRSAWVARSGSGKQQALWRIPVPGAGVYELYYYVSKDNEIRYYRHLTGNYHFQLQYGDLKEDVYINPRDANEGWARLSLVEIDPGVDTVRVLLFDDTKYSRIVADAVKLTKRN